MKIVEISHNRFIKTISSTESMLIEDVKRIFEILNKNSDGELSHNHDNRYYTEEEIDTMLKGYSGLKHNHNGTYYTKEEVVKTVNDAIEKSLGNDEIAISKTKPTKNEKIWFKVK